MSREPRESRLSSLDYSIEGSEAICSSFVVIEESSQLQTKQFL